LPPARSFAALAFTGGLRALLLDMEWRLSFKDARSGVLGQHVRQ
jgi:hypothetical protein